jgi:transcriptional regulator GlxA family with amidase domain
MDRNATHTDIVEVGVLVFDGVTLLDVSGPAEVFGKASAYGPCYRQRLFSPTGGEVLTSTGMRLAATEPAHRAGELDIALIAGGDALAEGPIRPDVLEAGRHLVGAARTVASVCTGAFVLAALGELDGRRATTHWRHARALAARYPAVQVEPDSIYVQDGPVLTSAGVSAGIDLALALVERDRGPETARRVAQELVVFLSRPGGQSQFSAAGRDPLPSGDPLRAVRAAVLADPAGPHSPATMAARAALSERQLGRLFRRQLATTPARWVESVRLEAAQRLLLAGHPVGMAARLSGLGSDETLRRVFARHVGVSPSDYRDRFATAIGGSAGPTINRQYPHSARTGSTGTVRDIRPFPL